VASEFGRHGSVAHHDLSVLPIQSRRYCRGKGCGYARRVRVTHGMFANGVCMASGCEWHSRKHLRDTLRARRAGAYERLFLT